MEKVLVEFQDPVTHLINTGQLTLYAISTLLSHCDQCDFKSVCEGTLEKILGGLEDQASGSEIFYPHWPPHLCGNAVCKVTP